MTPDRESTRASVLADLDHEVLRNELSFDRVAEVLASICEVEMANVSLMESDRQCLIGSRGFERDSWDRDISFCKYTLSRGDILIVEDATRDARFRANPLVESEDFHLRFYAGVPLFLESAPIGTLCVLDSEPGQLEDDEHTSLFHLAQHIEYHIGLLYHHELTGSWRSVLSQLTAAMAELEMLRHGESTDSQHESLDVIARHIEGAAKMLGRYFEREPPGLSPGAPRGESV